MKRSVDFKNCVDGSTLKKCKKLSFMLQKDEDELNEVPPTISSRNNLINVKEDSDCESDEESIGSLSDNEEILNDEYRDLLQKYNNPTIAENIISGMKDAREEIASNLDFDNGEELDLDNVEGLAEHIVELRTILKSYKRSKIFPKTVKTLPQTENWSYILDQFDFPSWTPTAVKSLSDQFRAKGGVDAEIFYLNYLLPYVRENINNNKRLDNQLFQALKDTLYRRKEFMKGILFPWCMDNIDGKEAEVLSNVIKNSTVKVDVGTPAMSWLASIDYSKGRLTVLSSFLEKKYKMPFKLISVLTDYFYKSVVEDFREHFTEKGQMPLLWFKTLNLFVSLNYMYMDEDSLKKISKICKTHKHDKVTQAIQGYLKLASNKDKMETE